MENYWFRCRRTIWRYWRWRDLAQVVMASAALVLAVNTLSVQPTVTIWAGTLYGFALLVTIIDVSLHRHARDFAQAKIVWSLFDSVNREVFNGDPRARFTLFRIPPFGRDRDHIVPWYRYRRGGTNAIDEAKRSKARYHRGESITGAAWEDPGRLQWELFPSFATANEFRMYYKDELELDAALVDSLSDYMKDVRTIYSYGFLDASGSLLAVLSLDLDKTAVSSEAPSDGEIDVNAESLVRLLILTRDILETLREIEEVER